MLKNVSLLVSFSWLSTLMWCALRYAMESKGPTLWSPHELNINVIVYSVQDKQKKLVETRSLTSHLVIRKKKKRLSANFYCSCCFHWMCCLSEYVSEITNPFGLMRDCLFFFSFFFFVLSLLLLLVCFFFFLCVRCKSLL